MNGTTNKAATNLRKHGVTFEEGSSVLSDPYVLIREDVDHSVTEARIQAVGNSKRLRELFVVFVEINDDTARIVMARKATRRERESYEKRKAKTQKR